MPRSGCLLLAIAVLFTSLFAGCASGKYALTAPDMLIAGGEYIGLINSYTMIRQDFDSGRIMRARARVLALPKDHADYERAQAFLKNTIEPARMRVFVHYLHMAQQREADKLWSEAMWAYDQAGSVTIKPEIMQAKRTEMEIRLRQLRLDELIVHRRTLDQLLLADAHHYDAPRGLDPNDETYGRLREAYNDQLDERASLAIREARRQLRKGLPEIAYMEIESYLRMQPGASGGMLLRDEILAAMPKGLVIPPLPGKASPGRKSKLTGSDGTDQPVSEAQVEAALKKDELIRARTLVHQFRRSGGSGADRLLAKVEKQVAARAAELFAKGSKAFRQEKLASAIGYWHEAVDLKPDEPEYVEALRRARQLQERLSLLRGQVENDKNAPGGSSVSEKE
ncbi:MAG: 4-hydroxy-3-methylbut-2-en-1-yl diphosphate synthase [Zetaproteobacteria bacterium CG12_big_fil_rev_8_21_14_0_65_54_13]|nr:MAG: 4-hydroxy-3-methylbut-2-en-1-yl diphosphate synthase [Zetaproteobacteria bacterium CG23_combo_of_CG06-09_8_20_14_all_54_7]PIW51241.1 MAG: 4-hydroxy-3-methylbut-2-en-1-yl diphosphate synthase [Zetaproteobacteria bacterium CG12_big_fil_rev_8_21_14_0_65_54_13]PIX53539.1 MAG: 4-hydroxy-3-methylbut-2-en-1-yl diphosphate synthase [Zetaproteobacteria bacterium CG_4_10_14_3_um_filter_54_28]PJA28349.1 MAG: 4-hydroxy-3-methylbut-2-en-1-yl diphosphate synthase [Zetaproteobacteria bacterium CG_4_9_1